jgi:hypothetical protein
LSGKNINRGTKEVQQGTKQGQPGTRQGQPRTKQGPSGTKQGQPGTKKGQGQNWTNANNSIGKVCQIALTTQGQFSIGDSKQKYISILFLLKNLS